MHSKALCYSPHRGIPKQALLIMKIMAFFLLVACLHVSAHGFSQKVTVSQKKATLEQVFNQLKKQTGFSFIWDEQTIKQAGRVDIEIKDATISEALNLCLKDQPFTYHIIGKIVVIKQKQDSINRFDGIGIGADSQPPSIRVTGRITNAQGEHLEGVSVRIKGTDKGTTTNKNGEFSIEVPESSTKVLIFSFVGMVTQEVDVSRTTSVNVALKDEVVQQQQVVVTALGISRQARTLVYAAQTVKTTELTEARDANNFINSLQGKVANAFITQGSGGPGSTARIVLRGNRSIQGSNNALIVVDGIPYGASEINPDDIESLTVLRGASAAALYGGQAGNGVIVITTKKGKSGRLAVTLNSGVALESPFSLPFVQNQYGQGNSGVLDPAQGDSWGPKMTGQEYTNFHGETSSYTPQPNNIKDFFRDGISLNNSIGVTGGTEKTQTYLSYTNNLIQGIIPQNDLTRHTFNFRIANQISKRFSTDARITYINQDIKKIPVYPVMHLYNMARNIPTADAMRYETINNIGIPVPTPYPSTLRAVYGNPYWILNNNISNSTRDRIVGFVSAKFKMTEWLSVSGRANLDRSMDVGEFMYAAGTVPNPKPGGNYQKSNGIGTSKWFDAMLEGNNTVTKDLKVNYRVGAIFQDNKSDGTTADANGLNVTNKYSINFAIAPSVNSRFSQTQNQAVFGQLNVSYKDAVYLDASLRNDWNSTLPSPHSFQYPSIGVSAVLSDLVDLPRTFSFLKGSVNYAEVGNGGRFGLLNAAYFYSQGAGNGFLSRGFTLPFPGLKPEIVKSLEFGAEARFFNNRIGFTATYYNSHSFNQLLRVSLPVATGYSDKYVNAGDIQNKGFEFVLNGTPVQTQNFTWDVAFNLGINRNKIVKLTDEVKIFYLGGGFSRDASPVVEEGKPYGDLLAFKWATDAKGNHIVASNGKPVLTQAQEYIGNFNPKATIGYSNSFTYKRFSLRILADGQVGGTFVSATEMDLAFSGVPEVTQEYREGGWGLRGVDADGAPVTQTITSQEFWQTASSKVYGAGEFFAYDATRFRVRELTFGYDIPVGTNGFVKSTKISFVGRNLFWLYRGRSILDIPGIGKRKMWFDADMAGIGNAQGVEYGNLPSTRSYGINLQVTF